MATRLSPHQIGVADLLDGAHWRDRYPSRVLLLGIVPESLDLEVGLSPRVAAALPRLVECVVDGRVPVASNSHGVQSPTVGATSALLMSLALPGCGDADRDLPREYRRMTVP